MAHTAAQWLGYLVTVTPAHVIEQITTRRATNEEARLLGMSRSAPILALYVSAREASGRPVLVIEIAVPGDMRELEDAYPVG